MNHQVEFFFGVGNRSGAERFCFQDIILVSKKISLKSGAPKIQSVTMKKRHPRCLFFEKMSDNNEMEEFVGQGPAKINGQIAAETIFCWHDSSDLNRPDVVA